MYDNEDGYSASLEPGERCRYEHDQQVESDRILAREGAADERQRASLMAHPGAWYVAELEQAQEDAEATIRRQRQMIIDLRWQFRNHPRRDFVPCDTEGRAIGRQGA